MEMEKEAGDQIGNKLIITISRLKVSQDLE